MENQKINSHADTFLYISVAIAIIGFIVGIICGTAFRIVELKETGLYASSVETVKKFNTGMMFLVWAGTSVTTLICWAIHCILDSMNSMLKSLTKEIKELKKASFCNEQNATKEE